MIEDGLMASDKSVVVDHSAENQNRQSLVLKVSGESMRHGNLVDEPGVRAFFANNGPRKII